MTEGLAIKIQLTSICLLGIIGISLIFNISPAQAIQVTNSVFNSGNYYQGDNGNISVRLYNDNSLFQWNIQTMSIQFDWMISDNTVYSSQINQNIVSGGSGTYNVAFSIPRATMIGWHAYTIRYVGLYNDVHILGTGNIYIHDYNERIYLNLENEVQNDFTNTNSNYQSPLARSDFSQAQSHFSQASADASQSQFLNAISELNSAKNLLNQAQSEEQSYIASQSTSNTNSGYSGSNSGYSGGGGYSPPTNYNIIFIIGGIMAAIAGGIVFFIKRRSIKSVPKNKRKQNLAKKVTKWWKSPVRKTVRKSKIISDDTQFYACPHCGGDISTKNNKQFCNICNQHV